MTKNTKWQVSEDKVLPDLDHDLNWMLQSRQVSRTFLVENLANQYYSNLYRLAFSFLYDHRAARVAVEQTLHEAVKSAHQYTNEMGVEAWLYRLAWKIFLRANQREIAWRKIETLLKLKGELSEPVISNPPTEVDRIIWQTIDGLPTKHRFFYILFYVHGWPTKMIARNSGEARHVIEVEIDQAHTRIMNDLQNKSQQDHDLEPLIVSSLQARWFISQISPEDIDHCIEHIERAFSDSIPRAGMPAIFREVLILLVTLVVVSVLVWVGINS